MARCLVDGARQPLPCDGPRACDEGSLVIQLSRHPVSRPLGALPAGIGGENRWYEDEGPQEQPLSPAARAPAALLAGGQRRQPGGAPFAERATMGGPGRRTPADCCYPTAW